MPLALQIITTIIAVATIFFAGYQYLRSQKWKRTEFIFTQCHYVENDPDIQVAVAILAERATVRMTDVFSCNTSLEKEQKDKYRSCFEKLFSLLDRLAYAVDESQSLTLAELAEFGWYYRTISGNALLKDYCKQTYPCLLSLAPRLETFIKKKWPAVGTSDGVPLRRDS